MWRRSIKRGPLVAAAALSAVCSTAGAASLTNTDAESQTIIVTEGGVKRELAIQSGETVTLCNDGCFLTLPSGDRRVLGGAEAVDIVNGSPVIKQ